jgi:cation-dependent mannose-6-phosphate receptor
MAKGREWLELLYTDGDKYRQHCDQEKRKTRIMFVCDPDAGKGKPIFLEENRDDQDCAYLFEWSTSLVCAGASNGLSPGSITLIVLFSVVVAYLLFGFLYQRFVVGAKGMEQIPNFTFWRKVGNLSADGCDMVCRCSEKAPPAKYKIHENLKDEDDDDEDSEKDDSLLPM